MKNLIFMFFVFIVISCVPVGNNDFTFNNPKFNSMQEACEWINQNISYKKDYYDDWKLPQETLNDGNGDCEDQALLLMGIMNYQKGYESEMIIIKDTATTYHAVVLWKDEYFDCTNGEKLKSDTKIIERYSYNNAMYMAEYVKNY